MVARRSKAKAFQRGGGRRSPRRRHLRGVLGEFISNLVLSRSLYAASRGRSVDPPGRDIDKECGYPDDPDVTTFRELYNRWGIAARVVNVLPDECWSVYPEVYETEDDRNTRFERAWKELNRQVPVCHYLHRGDRAAGIGQYGVVLLGLNHGPLDSPVPGVDPKTGEKTARRPRKPLKLLYLRPFSEDLCQILATEQDSTSPRYGQPTYYQLSLINPQGGNTKSVETRRVHWSRVLHIADNCESSDVVGVPRMKQVVNYLLDLRKTGGGSAEMFWKGAFPGFSFETLPDLLGESVMDEESIRDQFLEYMQGLKRYLALDGVTAKPLFPQVADPTAHANLQLMLICATLGVPLRILLGSEAAHLASTQDIGTWNKRVAGRQKLYVELVILRPFINRMVLLDILPSPAAGDYIVGWKDLNTMSDKDKALVSLQRAQALMQYTSGKGELVVPVKQFLTLILGLTPEEAQTCVDAAKAAKPVTDPLGDQAAQRDAALQAKVAKAQPRPAPQGGGRRGNPARRPAGRPAGNVPSAAV